MTSIKILLQQLALAIVIKFTPDEDLYTIHALQTLVEAMEIDEDNRERVSKA